MDEEAFVSELQKGSVSVIVKPSAKKTEIVGFDVVKKAWRVAVAAPREAGEANLELVRFLSRVAGKRVRIKSGLTRKQKVISAS